MARSIIDDILQVVDPIKVVEKKKSGFGIKLFEEETKAGMSRVFDRPAPAPKIEHLTQKQAQEYKSKYEELQKQLGEIKTGKPATPVQKKKLVSTMSEIINIETSKPIIETPQLVPQFVPRQRNLISTMSEMINIETSKPIIETPQLVPQLVPRQRNLISTISEMINVEIPQQPEKASTIVIKRPITETEQKVNEAMANLDAGIKKMLSIGKTPTLAQKLGLEQRLFSSDINRTEMQDKPSAATKINSLIRGFLGRKKAKKEALYKNAEIVGARIARRRAQDRIGANLQRALAQRSFAMGSVLNRMGTTLPSLDLIPTPPPRRLTDKEAKTGFYSKYAEERMILRDMATTLPKLELIGNITSSPTVERAVAIVENEIVKKMKRGAKGSQDAKDFMAAIRAKRIGGKRVLKAGTTYKGLSVFGPMNRPKGRSKKISVWDASKKRALKPGTIYEGDTVFGPMNRPKGRRRRNATPAVVAAAALPTVVPASAAPSTTVRRTRASKKLPVFGPPNRRGRPSKYTPPPVAAVAAVVPKKRGRPAKVITMGSGMMSIPRAVSTGNGAAARKGRPRKLTTDTARLVKDVVRLQKQGKSTKSITYGILTGSKGTAGKRGRPGIIVSDTARVVRDVIKLRGVRRR